MRDDVVWREVPSDEVSRRNTDLAATDASWRQYPFWAESNRRVRFRPICAVASVGGRDVAYVCMLSLGFPGFRVGLVEKGPVSLGSDPIVRAEVFESLRTWPRKRGYAFLRILTYPEQGAVLQRLPDVVPGDGFGLYIGVGLTDLLVPLDKEENAIFEGLQTTGRRNVRAAQKAGWVITRSRDPAELRKHWGIVASMADRKGLTFPRPCEAWEEVLAAGGPSGNATLYLASHSGRVAQMVLVLRDKVMAEYLVGALDTAQVADKPSPSALLHWEAIKDARAVGCRYYDLGRPGGPVLQFKRKFNPTERTTLAHHTLVANRARFGLWSRVALPLVQNALPMGGALVLRLRALRHPTGAAPRPVPGPTPLALERGEQRGPS